MRAKFVRGRDPKSAMGIGNPVIKNVVDYLYDESGPVWWVDAWHVPDPERSDVEEFVLGNKELLADLANWEEDWIPEENLTSDIFEEFQYWWVEQKDPQPQW